MIEREIGLYVRVDAVVSSWIHDVDPVEVDSGGLSSSLDLLFETQEDRDRDALALQNMSRLDHPRGVSLGEDDTLWILLRFAHDPSRRRLLKGAGEDLTLQLWGETCDKFDARLAVRLLEDKLVNQRVKFAEGFSELSEHQLEVATLLLEKSGNWVSKLTAIDAPQFVSAEVAKLLLLR